MGFKSGLALGLVAGFSLLAGCESVMEQEPRARVERVNGRVFILDQTDKRWDVTHAVSRYGFIPEEFQFGLGPNAIKPINFPQMIAPGEPGYPPANLAFIVIGTTIDSISRAYRVSDLTPHEIVNENFGNTPALVGW